MKTIISNFCVYLNTFYDNTFAEMVLRNLQEEPKDEGTQYKQSEIEDFKKSMLVMTECKFRMDISFLIVLFDFIYKKGKFIDGNQESHENYIHSIDFLF